MLTVHCQWENVQSICMNSNFGVRLHNCVIASLFAANCTPLPVSVRQDYDRLLIFFWFFDFCHWTESRHIFLKKFYAPNAHRLMRTHRALFIDVHHSSFLHALSSIIIFICALAFATIFACMWNLLKPFAIQNHQKQWWMHCNQCTKTRCMDFSV